MTQAKLVAELTNDAVIYAAAASFAFVMSVVVLDPKLIRSPIGKTLVLLDVGLLALYVPSILHRFADLDLSKIEFAWYYLFTLLLVGSAVLWRTVILITAQIRKRR